MNKNLLTILILLIIFSCKQNNTSKSNTLKTNVKDYTSFENGLNFNDSTKIGQSIKERLVFHKIPGASVAIFENGQITWNKEYGVSDSQSNESVDSTTKFQAASISKTVTALGVLKLVEKHQLDIDEDVNQYLENWKIDYSRFTDSSKVSIRRLLSHTAGINISGFKGYSKNDSLLSTTQVLNGKGNTERIKLDTIAGTKFSYSGGGYTILQALIEDVSEISFQEYFDKQVFKPLKMYNSTFSQFPKSNVSSGHDKIGIVHPEGWLIYPELAAAGLWTTTSDLVKFCIAIEKSYYGKNNSFISETYAKEMLKPLTKWSAGEFGLGVMLKGKDQDVFYFHTGSNPGGYRSMMVDFYNRKTGIVILTNSDNGGALYNEILFSFINFNEIKL